MVARGFGTQEQVGKKHVGSAFKGSSCIIARCGPCRGKQSQSDAGLASEKETHSLATTESRIRTGALGL
jgi:hypothetical protein